VDCVTIAEPDVTLTDYALTIECAILAWLVYRRIERAPRLERWFVVFFSAVGLAAFTGGTAHGFIHDKISVLYAAVWRTTLLAIGVSALAAWMIGSYLNAHAAMMQSVRTAAVALFVVYCVLALFVVNSFVLAVINYLPAALFLLLVYGRRYVRSREIGCLWGVIGLLLTFTAAGVQQGGVGLHAVWFDHNALYHLIQGVALLLLFAAARGTRPTEAPPC
jgi:intracellular septation protein A